MKRILFFILCFFATLKGFSQSVSNPSATSYAQNTSNQIASGFSVSGFNGSTTLLVTVGLVNPPAGTTLRFATTTGVSASVGYNMSSNFTRISFTGIQANITKVRNLKIWSRVLSTAEMRDATPSLSTPANFGASPPSTTTTSTCASQAAQSVTDRIIEPTCFTDNYDAVSAFEIKTMLNKYFNIERMADVEVLATPIQYEHLHEFYKPDIFGFQGKSLNKEIELEMSMRAYLVLIEEYPMSTAFIKPITGTSKYNFKANVQSFKAPSRFVLGFLEEVKVVGSKNFVKYVQRVISKSL
jgi:hypothetical protein